MPCALGRNGFEEYRLPKLPSESEGIFGKRYDRLFEIASMVKSATIG
jgi:hypothetical protein